MNSRSKFRISKKQIYTMEQIVDNGANMLRTMRLLREEDEKEDGEDLITESELIETATDPREESSSTNAIENFYLLKEMD